MGKRTGGAVRRAILGSPYYSSVHKFLPHGKPSPEGLTVMHHSILGPWLDGPPLNQVSISTSLPWLNLRIMALFHPHRVRCSLTVSIGFGEPPHFEPVPLQCFLDSWSAGTIECFKHNRTPFSQIDLRQSKPGIQGANFPFRLLLPIPLPSSTFASFERLA